MRIDFSGVEDDKGYVEITPGKYRAKVAEVTKHEGSSYPYYKWNLVITAGEFKGVHINHITTLNPKGLFNLRNTLLALGFKVPKAAINFDEKKTIGRELGIQTILKPDDNDETILYNNVKRVFSLNAVEDVTPTPSKATAADKAEEVLDMLEIGEDDVPF